MGKKRQFGTSREKKRKRSKSALPHKASLGDVHVAENKTFMTQKWAKKKVSMSKQARKKGSKKEQKDVKMTTKKPI